MKKITVIDGQEILEAIVAMMYRRPSMAGRFIGAVHMIADNNERNPALQIRANVVHFDTEKAALDYSKAPDPVDAPKPTEPAKPDA